MVTDGCSIFKFCVIGDPITPDYYGVYHLNMKRLLIISNSHLVEYSDESLAIRYSNMLVMDVQMARMGCEVVNKSPVIYTYLKFRLKCKDYKYRNISKFSLFIIKPSQEADVVEFLSTLGDKLNYITLQIPKNRVTSQLSISNDKLEVYYSRNTDSIITQEYYIAYSWHEEILSTLNKLPTGIITWYNNFTNSDIGCYILLSTLSQLYDGLCVILSEDDCNNLVDTVISIVASDKVKSLTLVTEDNYNRLGLLELIENISIYSSKLHITVISKALPFPEMVRFTNLKLITKNLDDFVVSIPRRI